MNNDFIIIINISSLHCFKERQCLNIVIIIITTINNNIIVFKLK